VQKFFADRGPHLAAMIAYFALLSFVPLTFLSLALLGLTGRADESSFLVREIKKTLPGTPIDQIVSLVHAVQDNAATLGIVGGVALLWTSLSLFSVLESALNIVYGRPNRSFLRGKGLAILLMISSLVTLFVALLTGSIGVTALQEYAPGFVSNAVTAYALSIGVSLVCPGGVDTPLSSGATTSLPPDADFGFLRAVRLAAFFRAVALLLAAGGGFRAGFTCFFTMVILVRSRRRRIRSE